MNNERIAKLKEFIEQDPADSFSRYALALEYAGRGDTQLAVSLLLDVIQRDPKYVPAYHQLGVNYEKLGRREEAMAIFRRGIETAATEGDLHAKSEMQEALDELGN